MSSPPWITVNERLQKGIGLINSISIEKFVLLLQRIVKSKEENVFTDAEYKKLEDSLKLNSNDVRSLVQCLLHIAKCSLKILIKPTLLLKQLTDNLQFKSDKAEEFVKVWTSMTKEDFDNLENRKILEDMSWELNLELSTQNGVKAAIPNARIKFKLSDTNRTSSQNVVFQLKEDELFKMYETLEDIQNTLDVIQSRHSK